MPLRVDWSRPAPACLAPPQAAPDVLGAGCTRLPLPAVLAFLCGWRV